MLRLYLLAVALVLLVAVSRGADPKPADPVLADVEADKQIPESERLDGDFRDAFGKRLGKQNTELPDSHQARHKYPVTLKNRWEKEKVAWADPEYGQGVPRNLNREFYWLHRAWLARYEFDPATFKPADFKKLNAAIEIVYKDFVILPTATQDDVKAKSDSWFKELHPTGGIVNGDEQRWKNDQPKRFAKIWKRIDGMK